LDELLGKETARHKEGREGKKELTVGLTRTKTEQTEEEEGVEGR
jgi:hypothetical protein